MKTVLQRVISASVSVDGKIVGKIDRGLLLLIGFSANDTVEVIKPIVQKILNLRIFSNEAGKFDKSVVDIAGSLLLVPQFTLFADTSKGRRPEFFSAMEPKLAREMFSKCIDTFRENTSLEIASGEFGAHMKVELINDGPVTIILE